MLKKNQTCILPQDIIVLIIEYLTFEYYHKMRVSRQFNYCAQAAIRLLDTRDDKYISLVNFENSEYYFSVVLKILNHLEKYPLHLALIPCFSITLFSNHNPAYLNFGEIFSQESSVEAAHTTRALERFFNFLENPGSQKIASDEIKKTYKIGDGTNLSPDLQKRIEEFYREKKSVQRAYFFNTLNYFRVLVQFFTRLLLLIGVPAVITGGVIVGIYFWANHKSKPDALAVNCSSISYCGSQCAAQVSCSDFLATNTNSLLPSPFNITNNTETRNICNERFFSDSGSAGYVVGPWLSNGVELNAVSCIDGIFFSTFVTTISFVLLVILIYYLVAIFSDNFSNACENFIVQWKAILDKNRELWAIATSNLNPLDIRAAKFFLNSPNRITTIAIPVEQTPEQKPCENQFQKLLSWMPEPRNKMGTEVNAATPLLGN